MPKIRVGFAGLDFMGSCLSEIRQRSDCELAVLITPDSEDPRSYMLTDLGRRLRVPVVSGRPDAAWITAVAGAQLDVLVAAAFRWRLPVDQLGIPYIMNVHPSLLPLGRGPNPLPHMLLGSAAAAGITIHEVEMQYDSGAILAQEAIEVGVKDATDIYLEMVARGPRLLSGVLDDLPGVFGRKLEQTGEASWLPEIGWGERTFRADTITVDQLETLSAIFGPFGLSALFPDGSRQEVVLRRTMAFDHGRPGGRFVQWSQTRGVLQIADGYALVSMSSLV